MRLLIPLLLIGAILAQDDDASTSGEGDGDLELTQEERDALCLDEEALDEMERYCGKQTAAAAKCLTPCYQEAQDCFKAVGTKINEIQACMMGMAKADRSRYCNSCIQQQLDARCDLLFECRNPENSVKFQHFDGYKRFCKTQSEMDMCKKAGCQWNPRGCTAKFSKFKCKRVFQDSVCEGIPGCHLKKKYQVQGEDYFANNRKKSICKGTTKWEEPQRKEGRKDRGPRPEDGEDG